MNKQERDRLADDAAILWGVRTGAANGCVLALCMAFLALVVFLYAAAAVFAQAVPADGYPLRPCWPSN
jgi:hypothetical protein